MTQQTRGPNSSKTSDPTIKGMGEDGNGLNLFQVSRGTVLSYRSTTDESGKEKTAHF